jgi:Tfp pilus assembly protein PilF
MKIVFKYFYLYLFFLTQTVSYSQEITAQKLFEKNTGTVVVIKCYDPGGEFKSQGSGVIINDKGILVTNFHVFAGSDKMEILHNDTSIGYSEILGINIEKDVMIVKLINNNYPQISVGNSSDLKIGEKVYAIGSPLGMENSISEGITSGFRTIGENKRNMIQITASISPGSSGGAVFNSQGELVGISTLKMRKGENMNFMIPINEVLSVADSGLYDKRSIQALKLFYKGMDEFENGSHKEAIKNYTKYLELVPHESKAYNFRGRAYLGLKDFDNALKDFKKALEIEKDNKAALCNRGECYFLMEEYDDAIKDFSRVIAIDSTHNYAYFARGLTYSKMEEYKKSLKDFNIFLFHDPNDVTGLINRGIVHFRLENYEKAIKDWKKVISLDPDYERDMKENIKLANYLMFRN